MSRRLIELCRLDELPAGSSRGFSLSTGEVRDDIFLVRTQDGVFGYRNSCPHTGGPLDWVPNRFLNIDGTLIQCATHAALFRIEDGLCVQGPCVGRSLYALAVEVTREQVAVFLDESGGQ
jgi:nitrite reductase/ring-hydroxylating ferredoxin subunit